MQAITHPPILSLQDISVSYHDVLLMTAINLDLNKGERVALKGPSGCGKTTLLRIIAGLINPSSGNILYNGIEIPDLDFPQFRRKVILVNQKPLLFDTTIEENLIRPFSYKTAHDEQYPAEKAIDLLARLGMADRLGQNAKSLSVGQQQRLCLVRSLLLNPDVLLLDEPTSALDPEAVEATERLLIDELSSRSAAAIIVSHNVSQQKRISTRVVDMLPHCLAENIAVYAGASR